MESVFDIALVFSPHEWVEALHRHCTNTGDLRIRSLIYDPSVLQAETFDACVISDSHPALSAGLVRALHDSGHCVLGVCDDEQAREFLASINIDGVFSSRLSADELSSQIQEFLTSTWNHTSVHNDFNESQLNAMVKTPVENTSDGLMFGVMGSGGVGATEISLVLASRLIDSVVVDTDFEHPSIAPRAGLDVNPHILDALESAHHNDVLDQTQRIKNSAAIVGVSHASFARDIKNYEIDSLCNVLTRTYAHTVLDLGRMSEDSSFFSHTRTLIEKCDALILVTEPTPVGVLRLLENIALIHSLFKDADAPLLSVVVNKCTKDRSMRIDIEQEIKTIEQVSHCSFLPYSRHIIENAWRSDITQPASWKKPMNELVGFLNDIRIATVLNYPTIETTDDSTPEREVEIEASA